ncbi:MAG TPA: G5 domain-containing protein [Actinotalea sp.]|nr:G5 domain-containing protein [Actinotalea sp.]
MPGQPDVWNLVNLPALLHRATARLRRSPAPPSPVESLGETAPSRPHHPHRARNRRRTVVVGAVAGSLVLAAGSVAAADAHKTVSLDIDGQTVQVATFAGSVAALLQDEGVVVGSRDVVAPAPDDVLRDGDEVVVRHARSVSVVTDGTQQTVWTTALSADDALDVLAARGQDVRLLASRSASTGRADLPLQLLRAGRVDVVADGATNTVDGGRSLDEVLDALDLTVGELDRVQVHRPAGTARLTITLQRVVLEDVTELSAVPFETATESTADLYTGQSRTVTAGVPGELTRVVRVVRVDGVEESREVLSEALSRAPVTAVVAVGTKARPVTTVALGDDVWGALARCESGGNPTAVSSNGLYYGLYQFSLGTWAAMGGSGLPTAASAAEQTQRAQALQARSGWGQWPACASKLGLL